MEELISRTTLSRLPAAIRELDEISQRVYILLRIRKRPHEIALQLSLKPQQTEDLIDKVRHILMRAGQIDLIEDPHFISIHADDDKSQDYPLASCDMEIDNRLIIKEFMAHLKDAVSAIEPYQSRLLRLRYGHQLSAKDIVEFCQKISLDLIPGKTTSEIKEQDVFYELNIALKEVLEHLKASYNSEQLLGMENLKYIFEEIGL